MTPSAQALQWLLNERRYLAGVALSLDGYERWGQGSDPKFEAFAASLGDIGGRIDSLKARFSEGVVALREKDPVAAVAVAKAHQTLLEQMITQAKPDSTAVAVANEELAGWRAVEAGTANSVQQNCYFVSYDADLFESLFGIPYGWRPAE